MYHFYRQSCCGGSVILTGNDDQCRFQIGAFDSRIVRQRSCLCAALGSLPDFPLVAATLPSVFTQRLGRDSMTRQPTAIAHIHQMVLLRCGANAFNKLGQDWDGDVPAEPRSRMNVDWFLRLGRSLALP